MSATEIFLYMKDLVSHLGNFIQTKADFEGGASCPGLGTAVDCVNPVTGKDQCEWSCPWELAINQNKSNNYGSNPANLNCASQDMQNKFQQIMDEVEEKFGRNFCENRWLDLMKIS